MVKANSVPEILLRAGRIVQPLAAPRVDRNAPKRGPEEAGPTTAPGDKKKMNRTITGNKKHKK